MLSRFKDLSNGYSYATGVGDDPPQCWGTSRVGLVSRAILAIKLPVHRKWGILFRSFFRFYRPCGQGHGVVLFRSGGFECERRPSLISARTVGTRIVTGAATRIRHPVGSAASAGAERNVSGAPISRGKTGATWFCWHRECSKRLSGRRTRGKECDVLRVTGRGVKVDRRLDRCAAIMVSTLLSGRPVVYPHPPRGFPKRGRGHEN